MLGCALHSGLNNKDACVHIQHGVGLSLSTTESKTLQLEHIDLMYCQSLRTDIKRNVWTFRKQKINFELATEGCD